MPLALEKIQEPDAEQVEIPDAAEKNPLPQVERELPKPDDKESSPER